VAATLLNNIPFDDRVNHTAELTDINITLIQSYLKETGSSLYESSKTMDFVDLCKSMNIVGALPEYIKPKNVGLMFFSFEPDKYFPYAQIDVVEFPEGLGGDKIIEKTFKGPLHMQLRDALLYIQNSIIQEQIIKQPDVAEAKRFFNYPYAAIEESLANAVYHKGYDEREPIEVRVLLDRIEIVSHPGADRSVSIEGLQEYKAYSRRYRNRRIGEFLKELRLTEGRNTGFKKIINALESNGSPLPVFETDEDRLSFAVTIYRHREFGETGDIVEGGVISGVISGVINGVIKEYTENEVKILACMREDPAISKRRISEITGITARTVDRAISELKRRNIITRQGSNKRGSWVVL
jgi:ATP-dependent DNA helicase RecG